MDDVAVYRLNKKGVPGIWACGQHKLAAPVDPEVRRLVHLIETAL